MLDDFQLWLSRRNIRPGLADWTSEREAIKRRLKQEILNQAISVASGDEIELRNDPLVRREITRLGARLMAHDLRALGINVDCLPVRPSPRSRAGPTSGPALGRGFVCCA